jgi:UDP-N-acetyl-D-mannosaminuronic acid dehydrogenase
MHKPIISVIGLGYMGLPMAALLAKNGFTVRGVDINPAVVARVNAGECPFTEPGLPELITAAHASGNLSAHAVPQGAEVFILSLPTPVHHATHAPDMSFVEAGARSIAPVLKAGNVVILESTSPVGATRTHVQHIIEVARPELTGHIEYVFCPERAIPGSTLREMVANDRLIGAATDAGFESAKAIYGAFCTGQLLRCTIEEAEMVKMVENASRDVGIAFANELSRVCAQLGLNVFNVIKLANHHPRVNILNPGTGVGGHCIAVDPWFIINAAPTLTPLMRAARAVNDAKPYVVVKDILAACLKTAKLNPTVACLGLAYKPDVDDLRESPSLVVLNELKKTDVQLLVVEPHLTAHPDYALTSLDVALAKADVVAILTPHAPFKALTPAQLAGKIVIDPYGALHA